MQNCSGNKLRIALFTETFMPQAGGVSTAHYNIYKLLKDRYSVKVFAVNEKTNQDLGYVVKTKTNKFITGIIVTIISFWLNKHDKHVKLPYLNGIIETFLSVKKLNRKLRIFKPDIIIVPDYSLPLYGLTKPVNSKVIWIMHHNYLRFRNNPLISNINWLDVDIAHSMEKRAYNKIDMAIAPSEYIRGFSLGSLKTEKQILVIPNFLEESHEIDIHRTNLHEVLNIGSEVRIVYIPSAGSEIKGKRYVFEIIRRLGAESDNIAFFLSGALPDDLNYELSSLKDLRIFKPGYLSWNENFSIVKDCNLTVSPNLEENFSYALLEAQAAGVPVVTFDTGGNKEIVQDGQTGYIVPYLDIESLITKSKELLCNAEQCRLFGNNAREFTSEHFNSHFVLSQFEKAFNTLIN